MQATEILFSLGGCLLNVMCLFICIVILICTCMYSTNIYINYYCINNESGHSF